MKLNKIKPNIDWYIGKFLKISFSHVPWGETCTADLADPNFHQAHWCMMPFAIAFVKDL